MARKQGNPGSGNATRKGSAAASPSPASDVTTPAKASEELDPEGEIEFGDEGEVPEAPELDTAPLDETTPAKHRPNPNMPAWSNPGQLAVDQPRAVVELPVNQDFSGQYRALGRLNLDGREPAQAGTVVLLDDQEARHFLKSGVVRPIVDEGPNGTVAARQNFAGQYIAKARLNLESGDRVDPGKQVALSDSEARHFLKTGAVVSATGFRL